MPSAPLLSHRFNWNDIHVFGSGSDKSLLMRDYTDPTLGASWLAPPLPPAYFLSGLVAGAIPFGGPGGATFATDPANLFYDQPNVRLGLGVPAPTVTLDLAGSVLVRY